MLKEMQSLRGMFYYLLSTLKGSGQVIGQIKDESMVDIQYRIKLRVDSKLKSRHVVSLKHREENK